MANSGVVWAIRSVRGPATSRRGRVSTSSWAQVGGDRPRCLTLSTQGTKGPCPIKVEVLGISSQVRRQGAQTAMPEIDAQQPVGVTRNDPSLNHLICTQQ